MSERLNHQNFGHQLDHIPDEELFRGTGCANIQSQLAKMREINMNIEELDPETRKMMREVITYGTINHYQTRYIPDNNTPGKESFYRRCLNFFFNRTRSAR